MSNINYFNNSEESCYNKFITWQQQTRFFDEYGRFQKGHWADASGYTDEELIYNVELKDRDQILCKSGKVSGTTYKDDTIVIESHKVADLLWDYILEGKKPWYMNFLHNDVVILFDLTKVGHPKKRRINARSKGYGNTEADYRFFLPLKYAAIWKKGKLVKKMGEEWNYEGMCEC